jgi:hypothetical protein
VRGTLNPLSHLHTLFYCCCCTCSFLRVVKLTLLGSIISNLLLVMGSAFVAGGIYHPMQHFNQQGINVNCGLLILSGEQGSAHGRGLGAQCWARH